MARVTIRLPSLLEHAAGGKRSVLLDAATIEEALAVLIDSCPGLRTHLFDERGRMREHVLCFHNKTNTRWLGSLAEPLLDGDELTILQAVTGG